MAKRFKYVISRFESLFGESRALCVRLRRKFVADANAESEQIPPTTDPSVVESQRTAPDPSVVESQMFESSDYCVDLKEVLLSDDNDKDLFFISVAEIETKEEKLGIGYCQTALARALFKDAEVVNHFDERMWVCVSKGFDIDTVLKEMLQSLTRMDLDVAAASRDAIILKLLERLKWKKYLLVLDDVSDFDDVWYDDDDSWNSFTECLLKLGGSRGSIIMVTTLQEVKADHPKPGLSYMIAAQPYDYGWKLFKRIAFAPGGPTRTPELEGLGKSILECCGGVPLLIKAMGGLLYSKKDTAEWRNLLNELKRMPKQESPSPRDDALKLCYDRLPSELKECFRVCSTFPKDAVMEKDELIQLWMAQGLLNSSQGRKLRKLSVQVLGAQYLDILMRRSFLQNAEHEFDGRKFYRMHDRFHDLAVFLSEGYCLLMEGTNFARNGFEAVHMSLIDCQEEISESLKDNFRKLQTLRVVNYRFLGDILAYTTSLRVLILVDRLVEELPGQVSNLKLLHYLDISKTKIRELPDSISKLNKLQTLRLYDLIQLPENFENLVNLEFLYIESFKELDQNSLPDNFQKQIYPSSFKASFKACLHKNCPIEKLNILKHAERYASLKICRLQNVSASEAATKVKLSSRSTLECLKLHWNERRDNCSDEEVLIGLEPHRNIKNLAIENYKGYRFPLWMMDMSQQSVLNYLVKMELEDCSCCDKVPPLGHLPHLKIVMLLGMANVKSIENEFYGLPNLNDPNSSSTSALSASTVFRKLRVLTLRKMTCLENWYKPANVSNSLSVCPLLEKFEVEQCPKLISLPDIINSSRLRRLEIALCDRLASLPDGLGRLNSLEDLDIRGLPSLSLLSIGCCDNLKSLTIGGFSGASGVPQTSLHLKGEPGILASLPEELQYLRALRYLTISGYGGLESLPEWFSEFQSLQILKLEFCWKLMHLPAAEKMKQLNKLEELDIYYCPLLEDGCTKGSRPEWDKISHIRRIKINSEKIESKR